MRHGVCLPRLRQWRQVRPLFVHPSLLTPCPALLMRCPSNRLWDLRNVRSTLLDRDLKKQHLNGLARSKVVQTVFRGRGELDLLEVAHFSRLSIRG